MPSSLDPGIRAAVSDRLSRLPGVRRTLVDESAGSIWMLCDAEAERLPLYAGVRNVLLDLGIDPVEVPVELAVPLGRSERQRVRFRRAERIVSDETHVTVRVTLEWQGDTFTGQSTGEVGAGVELRTAALAALEALHAVTGGRLKLRLTGVKQIRAFDSDLTVASVHEPGPPAHHYVGTVLSDRDALRSSAVAVLNGLNRMLGNYLATES
jgi:hypothetical protein